MAPLEAQEHGGHSQEGAANRPNKASIQVLGNHGYVWYADVAHWLRLECGLMGAAVGGVAAFKQQNAVRGLPLELSPEEVTLALEKGWAELQPCLNTAAQAAALAGSAGTRGKRGRDGPGWGQYGEDDDVEEEEEEEEGGYEAAMDDDDGGSGQQGAADPAAGAEPTWRAALAEGAGFVVPTTPAEAAAANAGAAPDAAAAGARGVAAAAGVEDAGQGLEPQQAVQWSFPETEEERHRYWVFRDLHSRGYRLTGGSKFGSDFLVYPGDPTLYHAQFCVRLMRYRQPVLPAMLAAATRGSHQARKHLLIASVVEEEQQAQQGAPAVAHGSADGAGKGGLAASGSNQPGEQQWRQQERQQPEEQQQDEKSAVQPLCGGGTLHAGLDGVGAGRNGGRFRIRYMTIGPVEGFG